VRPLPAGLSPFANWVKPIPIVGERGR